MLMHWRQLGVKTRQGCLVILVKSLVSLCAPARAVQVANAHKVDKTALKTNRPLRHGAEPAECVIVCLVS